MEPCPYQCCDLARRGGDAAEGSGRTHIVNQPEQVDAVLDVEFVENAHFCKVVEPARAARGVGIPLLVEIVGYQLAYRPCRKLEGFERLC